MDHLPIDPLLLDIAKKLRQSNAMVIEAPPGAGKTTRVPRALLDAGFGDEGEIVVLQPRRLSARLGAARVAQELAEPAGGIVGYTVRFEDISGPRTRIRFVTEGILGRRILTDPTLRGISVVVLDEFHERHLTMDMTLAWLRRLQHGARPDLKVCVMSATLNAAPVAAYLGGCSRVTSEGRRFDVRIEHAPEQDDRPLVARVTAAVRRILREEPSGDVLVFLPGAADIRRCGEALAAVARAADLLVLPLHGDLALEDQARVVTPAAKRKVILSTNVAETSITIDGVVAVVDSGLAHIAGHSAWTGLATLSLAKISQASAIQRAGRAGRTRAGVALRLYTRHDFDGRRAHDVPEIARLDLCELVLTLKALGIRDPADLQWLTPPPPASLRTAEGLLSRLGAVDDTGALTGRGARMVRFPVHPRLARLLVEGEDRGVAEDAAALVSLIGERDIRERRGAVADGQAGGGGRQSGAGADSGVDVITLLDLFEQAGAAHFARDRLRALGLDPRSTAMAEQSRRQLAALLRTAHVRKGPAAADRTARDQSLCRAALTAFSDRVARRRNAGDRTVVLASGGTAEVAYEPDSDLIVALDVEDRASNRGSGVIPGGSTGRSTAVIVRLGCGIEPDWLADLPGGDLQTSDLIEFDVPTERVVRRSRLTFGAVVLDETTRPADPSPQVGRILADAALARGAAEFDEPGVLSELASRLALLGTLHLDMASQHLDDSRLHESLVSACDGLRGFAELRQVGLATRLTSTLPPAIRARLASDTPTHVTLPGGRAIRVNYPPDQPPWIESRIQDFFGMAQGPAIAGGRVPLTLHLLAPNGRAVQVTRDLESFWHRHYPEIRRELGRRYPRHSWPDNGRTATPPPPSQRRR
jgi:ATP-dependent helicase HrpB